MREQDADALRLRIENLILQYPEIAEDEVLRADMLDGETPITVVMTDLIRTGQDTIALRDATKQRLADLKARGDRFDRRIDFIKSLMMAIMEAAGTRKFELPEATIYFRNNPQQIVGEPNADTLPDELVRIKREPDRAKIKEALKAGLSIEGLSLSNSPPSIVVTVR